MMSPVTQRRAALREFVIFPAPLGFFMYVTVGYFSTTEAVSSSGDASTTRSWHGAAVCSARYRRFSSTTVGRRYVMMTTLTGTICGVTDARSLITDQGVG